MSRNPTASTNERRITATNTDNQWPKSTYSINTHTLYACLGHGGTESGE